MSKKILGLDLGTNSIGWAVVETKSNGTFKVYNEKGFKFRGVHIFQEATNRDSKGTESSKAAERTKYRSARKNKYRRKLRKIETLSVLSEYGYCPKLEKRELNAWRYERKYPENIAFRKWQLTSDPKGMSFEFAENPYYYRWLVSTEKLDLNLEENRHKLGRAFYHLVQRRGFKSNRLDAASDDAKGDLRDRMISVLDDEWESTTHLSELLVVFEELGEGLEDNSDAQKFYRSTMRGLNRQKNLESALKFLKEHLHKKENLGKVARSIESLDQEMADGGYKTLGQLFWDKYYKQGKRIREQYTSREKHYENEFKAICCMQGISEDDDFYKKLHNAIFYQRPLKSQKGLVAKCPFEHDVPRETTDGSKIAISKKRAPISHPLFEEFRMWQTLNNIKIQKWSEKPRVLTQEEKLLAVPRFLRAKTTFNFEDIARIEALTPKGQECGYIGDDSDAQVRFNYRKDQSVPGSPFSAKLKSLFGTDFKSGLYAAYCANADKTKKKIHGQEVDKTPDDVLNEVWHVLFSFTDPERLKTYGTTKLGLDEKQASDFSKIKPRQGYGALSLTAIRRILPWLRKGYIYSHAVFLANVPYVIGQKIGEFSELEEEIKKLIDGHGIYQMAAKLSNHFTELTKENPAKNEDVEHWLNGSGRDRWRSVVQRETVKLFGVRRWDELGEDGQQALCQQARGLLAEARRRDDSGTDPFNAVLTIETRVKELLATWAKNHGVWDEVEPRLDRLYHPSKEEPYEPDMTGAVKLLGCPEISSIRNPVFNRAMYRLKAVINELLRHGTIDEDTVVHLEMARELNDANRRAALRKWNEKRRKLREFYKVKVEEVLRSIGEHRDARGDEILKYQLAMEQNKSGSGLVRIEASDSDMLKYQLWEEQNHICLYTGRTISLTDFIGHDPCFDIEHTVPRSRSCDNSQENKTLCELAYNRTEKKNRLPSECLNYEDILSRISHWKKRIDELEHLIDGKKRAGKTAADKETKDRIIQDRLVLQFERDYLHEKYRRFTMKDAPEGFKNSQLVDTRIITKYARSYLKSVFSTVHTVNGKITDDFRHYWGLQNEFEQKDRSNHAHHTVDAVVVACITRRQYQLLAEAYKKSENGNARININPPWDHFARDMMNLKNEILVSHYAPNHLLKQTKRNVKVRGTVLVKQGRTARGSLHKDTFYGAIKRIKVNKKGEAVESVKYVVRKPLSDLKDSDLKNIVDDRIREEIVIPGRSQESKIKKEVETLKKKKATSDEVGELAIREEIVRLEERLSGLYTLPNKNGNPIPIKKVRIYSNLTNPIELKEQRDKNSKTPMQHKEHYYVNNDGNYLMAIYEGKGKKGSIVRESCIVENLIAVKCDAGELVPLEKGGIPLKCVVRSGMLALLLQDTEVPADIRSMSAERRAGRLYIIRGLDDDGIKLYFHLEARQTTEVLKHMNTVITESHRLNDVRDKQGNAKESKLTTPKGGDVIGRSDDFPYVKFKPTNFNALLEGVDFRLNVLGDLEFMEAKPC